MSLVIIINVGTKWSPTHPSQFMIIVTLLLLHMLELLLMNIFLFHLKFSSFLYLFWAFQMNVSCFRAGPLLLVLMFGVEVAALFFWQDFLL